MIFVVNGEQEAAVSLPQVSNIAVCHVAINRLCK